MADPRKPIYLCLLLKKNIKKSFGSTQEGSGDVSVCPWSTGRPGRRRSAALSGRVL